MIGRLWRHSVAVSVAARWLARDAGDPDPHAVARAGLLCRLGCWAVAAVDPDWVLRWWQDDSPVLRRKREIADLGAELDDLGRRLAERWGCDPAGDRRGLAARRSRRRASARPLRSPTDWRYIQEACRWVEQTPWSLAPIVAGADAVGASAANPGRRSSSSLRLRRSPRPTPRSTKKS